MNDDHEQEPDLAPEDEAHIRALLADLGTASGATPGDPTGAPSMPPEVMARLDETVARLVAERDQEAERNHDRQSGERDQDNVVPLRRRWASRAAAAAAAVIVIGAGGVAAANLGVFDGNTTQSDSAAGGASSSKAESLDDSATPLASPAPQSQLGSLEGRLPVLSSATFGSDAARVLAVSPAFATGRVPADTSSGDQAGGDGALLDRESAAKSLRTSGCPGPPVRDGAVAAPVRLDGQLAVMVVRPESGGNRVVEAWTCSGAQRLDRAVVPVKRQTSGQSDPGLGSPSPSP